MSTQCIEEGALAPSRLRSSPLPAGQEHDTTVTEADQVACRVGNGGLFVRTRGGNGQSLTTSEKGERGHWLRAKPLQHFA